MINIGDDQDGIDIRVFARVCSVRTSIRATSTPGSMLAPRFPSIAANLSTMVRSEENPEC